METLTKCCNDLEDRLNNGKTPEELLDQCARERLISIYESENKEFDTLLDKLSVSIDYNAATDVKRCVTKLLRLMNKNRTILTKALRRLY